MAQSGVTVYDILLSCPNDIVELKSVIQDCIESFNISLGKANNIRLELKHWSNSSFSQFGERPQGVLNRQFINDCDLCVALIGSRFGSPTGEYDSGTEEEIENMISQGKQVFLYFFEKQVDLGKIDVEQLGRVQEFKKKYTGIYATPKSEEELRIKFTNDLALFFVQKSNNISPRFIEKSPKLIIDMENQTKESTLLPQHTQYCECRFIVQKFADIEKRLRHINKFEIKLSKLMQPNILSQEEVVEAVATYRGKQTTYTKIEIGSSDKQVITEFCATHNILIGDDFFDLGNLQSGFQQPYMIFTQSEASINGTESEKEKHKLICDVAREIRDYNRYIDYFKAIDKLYCLSFIIKNEGTTFDEDIDIKLYVPHNCLVSYKMLPKPNSSILKFIMEHDFLEGLFKGNKRSDICEYIDYPMGPVDMHYFPPVSYEEEFQRLSVKYANEVERLFCYDIYREEEVDVICFNISYMKQHTSMFFPSYLFFKKMPTYIKYKITSKHSPNELMGKFDLKE